MFVQVKTIEGEFIILNINNICSIVPQTHKQKLYEYYLVTMINNDFYRIQEEYLNTILQTK